MMKCPKCGYEFPKHPNRGQFIKTIAKGASNLKAGVKTVLKKPPVKRYNLIIDENGNLRGPMIPKNVLERIPLKIKKYLEYERIKAQVEDD
jgi:hypothetical protein